MRQKAALAGALVHEPKLLMLDEPLTGLDAASARQVKDLLAERVAAGATVILTTHILEVAERLASRIGILAHGRLIAEGALDDLRRFAGKENASLEDLFLGLTGGRGARGVSALAAAGRLVVHDARLFARSAASFLGERSALSKALIVVAACVVAHAFGARRSLEIPARRR